MTHICADQKSFHRYGDNDPIPDRVRVADSVSVARCSCGRVLLKFHHPATTNHPGRVFAVAHLDPADCANIGDEVLRALDSCRHNMICDGKH